MSKTNDLTLESFKDAQCTCGVSASSEPLELQILIDEYCPLHGEKGGHCFTARGDHDCCRGQNDCSCECDACEAAWQKAAAVTDPEALPNRAMATRRAVLWHCPSCSWTDASSHSERSPGDLCPCCKTIIAAGPRPASTPDGQSAKCPNCGRPPAPGRAHCSDRCFKETRAREAASYAYLPARTPAEAPIVRCEKGADKSCGWARPEECITHARASESHPASAPTPLALGSRVYFRGDGHRRQGTVVAITEGGKGGTTEVAWDLAPPHFRWNQISDLELVQRSAEVSICGKYLGDNDGTCPQLTCIRDKGHDGRCDNVQGDPRSAALAHCGGHDVHKPSCAACRRDEAERRTASAKSETATPLAADVEWARKYLWRVLGQRPPLNLLGELARELRRRTVGSKP